MKFSKKFMLVILLMTFFVSITALYALEENCKKVLIIEDYARWRIIVSTSISDDGN